MALALDISGLWPSPRRSETLRAMAFGRDPSVGKDGLQAAWQLQQRQKRERDRERER